jgi:hypothetical protein
VRSSTSGLLLLLIGSIGLIGFLSGQLDRWLGFLFTPPGSVAPSTNLAAPVGTTAPASTPAGDRRQVA